jgi:predicted dehydrogenase
MNLHRDSPLNVGIAGLGYVGAEHAKAFAQHPGARITALCDLNRDRALACRSELGLDCDVVAEFSDLIRLPELDAVVIATPNPLHADQVVAAAGAGKAILLEKPAALTRADLNRIEQAVEDAGVVCEVDLILRIHPAFEAALDAHRRGDLGDVFCVEAEMLYGEIEIPEPAWERTREGGGNIQIAVGCHAYDQVLRFATAPPVEVMGLTTSRKPTWEFDPVSTVIVRFANGSIGRVTTILEAQMPYAFNLRVFGTRGTIINGDLCVPDASAAEFRPLVDGGVDVSALPFDRMADAFIARVRGTGPSIAAYADVRRVFDLALAADEACRSGRPVQLASA